MTRKAYDKVESEYIRDKIREGDFENESFREYIDALVYTEEKILNGPSGYADAMKWHHLKISLREVYRLIHSQVASQKYRQKIIREAVEAIEESLEPADYKTKAIKERLEDKESWERVQESE